MTSIVQHHGSEDQRLNSSPETSSSINDYSTANLPSRDFSARLVQTFGSLPTVRRVQISGAFSRSSFPRQSLKEWLIVILMFLQIPMVAAILALMDKFDQRTGITVFIVLIYTLAGTFTTVTNIIPFVMYSKTSRPVMLELLFNISLAEILNSIYYILGILLGPEGTEGLYMSLMQQSQLPRYYMVWDLYLPLVSTLFSMWMCFYFRHASIISDARVSRNPPLRWIPASKVVMFWIGPALLLVLMFLGQVSQEMILAVALIFRTGGFLFYLFCLCPLLYIETSKIFQMRLFVLMSMAWQFAFILDDAIPEGKSLSTTVRNLVNGYIPFAASFARILMNGLIFAAFNPAIVRRASESLLFCREIDSDSISDFNESEDISTDQNPHSHTGVDRFNRPQTHSESFNLTSGVNSLHIISSPTPSSKGEYKYSKANNGDAVIPIPGWHD